MSIITFCESLIDLFFILAMGRLYKISQQFSKKNLIRVPYLFKYRPTFNLFRLKDLCQFSIYFDYIFSCLGTSSTNSNGGDYGEYFYGKLLE